MQKYKMWIGGKWVTASTGKTFDTFNPATGEKIAQVPLGDKTDVDKAVEAARKAFPIWSQKSLDERAKILYQIASVFRKHAAELAELEVIDHGFPIKLARMMMEDFPGFFEYCAQSSRAFLGQVIPSNGPTVFYTRHEPRGVCALIVPWNVPVGGACIKLSAALATGNTVVLKPSSVCSLGTLKLGEILAEVDLPPGTVNIITGPGGEVGEAMVAHHDVRMVSFTGSCEVGKRIMASGAGTVKKLQMELGGKNPCIVLKDANIDAAVRTGVMQSFFNTGQVCTCPGRFYVHESIYNEFIEKFIAATKAFVTGDPMNEKTDMGPLVSAEQRDKVEYYIKLGIEEGARLVYSGKKPAAAAFSQGFWVAPAIFADVTQNMRIAREEIFGPVACILKFSSEIEVVDLANDSDFGLVASVWTRNVAKGINMANRIQAGSVAINDHVKAGIEIPHGGYKESGFSKEKSMLGMEEFTQIKLMSIDLAE
jgi:acyl-CoA reductase-like NAD-dependent aldehyde dehydrogenase